MCAYPHLSFNPPSPYPLPQLSERNHAVLLTGVALLQEMASISSDCLTSFRRVRSQDESSLG